MARILIIDDEAGMRNVMRECLQGAGHYVAVATSGDEGWAYVRRKPFDLIVTDLFMPNVDGFAFIGGIRREYPSLKILVVSGAGGLDEPEPYLSLAKRMGAHAILGKPVRMQELVQTVQFLLGDGAEAPPISSPEGGVGPTQGTT